MAYQNSQWEKRFRQYATDRERLGRSLSDPAAFAEEIRRYRRPVSAYLGWFLLHHKFVAEGVEASLAITGIWEELLTQLPETLAEQWSHGGRRFRDLLREGTHEACHRWQRRDSYRPAVKGLAIPGSGGDEAWYREIRGEVLERAREKLRCYQQVNKNKHSVYFDVFRMWEEHREPYQLLIGRLAAVGRPLSDVNFRQTLRRAQDKFGGYLFDEIAAFIRENEAPTPEKCREAFEELDLMDDYAMQSRQCLWLLGMEEDAE